MKASSSQGITKLWHHPPTSNIINSTSATMPTPSKPTKQPKFNTLTTAGRIAKAAHARVQATAASTPTSPSADSPPPKKKSRKIPFLAPPAELEAEAARCAEAKKKPKAAKKPLLTTQDKIAASKKKKHAVVPTRRDGKDSKAISDGEAQTKGGKRAAKMEKPRNLMDIMRGLGQMNSAIPAPTSSAVVKKVQTVASGGAKGDARGKGKAKESVLVRPTERTGRMQQSRQHQNTFQSAPVVPCIKIKREDDDVSSSNKQASLMGLPLELRQRIWRLAVVETEFFVYPAINVEQPDLAMTSRQIRNEVLPLYYGENIFAIELPTSAGAGMGKRKAKDPERMSLARVEKWMAALAGRGYLGTIRKWAFSWAPPLKPGLDNTGTREVIISICYHKPGSASGQATQPAIEVHRQAFCLLESHELYQPCVCMCYPEWLNDAVAAAVLAERQNRGKHILMVAKVVEKRGVELIGSRCEDDVMELE
jgi:hypothetical protein